MVGVLDRRVDGYVRHVFDGSGYLLGRFVCPPDADRWDSVNWIGGQPHVVVPDTAVRLIPDGDEAYVSTVNHGLVYDRDVHFRRRLVSTEGDRCTFAIVSDDLAAELGIERPQRRGRRPRLRYGSCGARAYALLHQAHTALADPAVDLLAVDEAVLSVLRHVTDRVAGAPQAGSGPSRPATARARRQAVEQVKTLLASDPSKPWTLAELAAGVHYSAYCLARMFRAHTGYAIAAYRRQLLLRASLRDAAAPGADLSSVAAAYGFSSHSHYTRVFRQVFGCTPSKARAAGFQVLTR
ncbi:helix-turn-helix transcriptional regulator [Micromonospora sp. CPCC 205371]|nr:helix-turn-helix transcriptional regulator [Micromonospora sp. CPCC 205371]